ncbi:hypothetical protein Mgra_00004104 [Meloidogyne graminicola]|uniref:Uncharacterized protein n=1 Tax=Meloidogyne graminicola TaxID=189291 RepID=A0A8S9ZTJ8_9BILA|nr:hypothetical protein Mgra_00004104 [Meloidogyne graminicola]
MYPKIVDQITGSLAKVVQKATDAYVFQDLPECGVLIHTERLSIKLIDPQIHRCLVQLPAWRPDPERLESITFSIRDEANRKNPLMCAQLQNNGGIILKNIIGKTIMLIRLPIHHSADSLGKILHPSQATLYKLMRCSSGPDFKLVKASSDEAIVLRVEKVHISLQSLGKAIGLMGTDCVYYLKSPDGQTVLGHVRPKFAMKRNTLIVKFMSKQKDIQLRAAMLGTGLLLLINEVYPQLKVILADNNTQQNIE